MSVDVEWLRRRIARADDAVCDMVMDTRVVAELLDRLEAAERERDEMRYVMCGVVGEIPHRDRCDGNAPGHGHAVPGVWDYDNGALAGKPCGWCAVWAKAKQMAEEPTQ